MCVDDLCSCVHIGFLVIKRSVALCAEACSCVRDFEDLKGSAAECVDQNCGFFCKELNKIQFCGRSPYTGGEPRYILCCGSFVLLLLWCYFYALISR